MQFAQERDKAAFAAACRTLLWNTKEQAGASASRQHLLDVLDSLGAQDQAPWSAQCAVQRQAQQVCPQDNLASVSKCDLVIPFHCLQVDSRGSSLPVEGAKELLIVTQQDKPLECCLVLRWTAWSNSRPCLKQLATSGPQPPAACRSETQLLHGDSGLPLVLEKTGLYKRRLLLVFEVGAAYD